MKKRFTSLLAAAFVALLALQLQPTARAASAEKSGETASQGRFQLSWSRHSTREFELAEEKFRAAERGFKQGNISAQEVEVLRSILETLHERIPYLFNLTSRGGSLREFLAVATGPEERSFTVINAGEPSDLDTPLPAFELRNSNWGTVMGVLGNILVARGFNLSMAGSDFPDPSVAKSIVCVLRRIEPSADEKRPTAPAFESFQLVDHIYEGQTVDVIVDAIRTAWELDPQHDAAALRLKFHPATKILLVSGPASATTIARQVVGGLRKKPVQH